MLDINECLAAALELSNLCESDQNTKCVNNIGSYECVCVPGYVRDNGTCQRKSYYNNYGVLTLFIRYYNTAH